MQHNSIRKLYYWSSIFLKSFATNPWDVLDFCPNNPNKRCSWSLKACSPSRTRYFISFPKTNKIKWLEVRTGMDNNTNLWLCASQKKSNLKYYEMCMFSNQVEFLLPLSKELFFLLDKRLLFLYNMIIVAIKEYIPTPLLIYTIIPRK